MPNAAGAMPNSKRPFGQMDRKSCWSLFRFGVARLARLPWVPVAFAEAPPCAGMEALPLIIFHYQNLLSAFQPTDH